MTASAGSGGRTDGPECHVPGFPVHELFLRQARDHPDAPAIRQWDRLLSYGEVAASATALAGRLRAAGVGPGVRAAICLRRTPWLPISELAVPLCGGAFVPLDPDQPRHRLRTMVDDADVTVAVTDTVGSELLTGIVDRIVRVDERGATGADEELAGHPSAGPDDIAYIMYTSGSTGRPKGVMVSHRNLMAFTAAINQHLGEGDRYQLAAFAAMGFDVSIFEIFAPLSRGASVHLVPDAERADAELLQAFLEEHRSSHVFLPPVLLPLLEPSRLPDLRAVIVGGEACDPRQVGRWAVDGRRFCNWYGPTEATVAVTAAELSGTWTRALPIGRPLPGSSVYILDHDLQTCAPGVVGELYIGGPQVALGYATGSAETASRFIRDPFSGGSQEPESRSVLYRTGDQASWDEHGTIWFMGRIDRQLKINGRRVEPTEIEAVLSGHPRVKQAAVDVSGSVIRAYVTSSAAPSGRELRQYCAAWLPRQMIPATVTVLSRIPLTANAKVDFAQLAALGRAAEADARGPEPSEHWARVVAQCWSDLFGNGQPRLDDDFFESGGDSLQAMILASALRKVTSLEFSVADVLAGRTVGGIAELLHTTGQTAQALPSARKAELSPAQRRIWFIEQLAPGLPVHNIVLSERITGPLDAAALEGAFAQVASRQTALRWRLRPGPVLPAVVLADPALPIVRVDDLSGLSADARQTAVSKALDEEARTPLALIDSPLWRVRLLRITHGEHVLCVVIHHLIFDGWSQAVLYRELSAAYRRCLPSERMEAPASAPVTFADYTAWSLERAARSAPADLEWWRAHLADAPMTLDLPRDRPRPAALSFAGAVHGIDAPEALAADVARLAVEQGTTMSTVLLAAFGVLLRRLSGQSDMMVGMPVVDRGRADFEDLVGFMVDLLPLRLKPTGGATFSDLIHQCADEFAAVRAHAHVPLERIVEIVGDHGVDRNPVFQVMFNVYNFAEAYLEIDGTMTSPVHVGVPGSHVDLTLYVIISAAGMRFEAAYNRDLYDPARIDCVVKSYALLLAELVAAPDAMTNAACIGGQRGTPALPNWTAPLPEGIPATPGLVEQIKAVCHDRGDAVAVEGDGAQLSYREVLRVSDCVAAALRATGLGVGDTVVVLAERVVLLAPTLLGVLSTGARWLILDADLPAAVLRRRLGSLNPRAVAWFSRPPQPGSFPDPPPGLINVRELAAAGTVAESVAAARRRGYLSVTSGTTGEPKVVHAGEAPLVHFLNWYRAAFSIGARDRFALLSGLAHDPLLRDIFTPLTAGAALVVPEDPYPADPVRLLEWLATRGITAAHLTPQLLRLMTAGNRRPAQALSLRLIGFGGDQLTRGDIAAARQLAPGARLLNFYGTTETPQAQAYHEVTAPWPSGPTPANPSSGDSMPVPVGVGIDGVQLLVMSACGQPAAVGELGEVIIRSRHLSDGYTDPAAGWRYAPLPGAGAGDIFRTGDLGRYDPSGAVTLAGRADDQVKVRGFRVDLAEVEAVLRSHPDVAMAAVQVVESAGAQTLHAFVTAAGQEMSHSGVLHHARSQLPSYAVPTRISVLPELPLSGNGKINRKMLLRLVPADDLAASEAGDIPEGEAELLVMSIWCEVLDLPWVARNQNFFEVGGHSMAIMEVQWRLSSALGRQVPVVDLFRYPTIKSIAERLAFGGTDTWLLEGDTRGRMRKLQRASRGNPYARQENSR